MEKDQKKAGTQKKLCQKIIVSMPVSHAKEFLKYVLYFHTFLQELPIAPAQIWAVIDV